MTDARYNSTRWKRLRKSVRQRDRERCQLKLPGCSGIAQSVDHIIEPGPPAARRDDLFFSASNLQASCTHCNVAKRNQRRNRLARQAEGETELPPLTTAERRHLEHYPGSEHDDNCLGCRQHREQSDGFGTSRAW